MSCTRHVVLKVVVKIVSSECDAWDYAIQWAKRENEDLDTFSEWVKSVRSLMQIRIKTKTQ
jgi:hypothetical protein